MPRKSKLTQRKGRKHNKNVSCEKHEDTPDVAVVTQSDVSTQQSNVSQISAMSLDRKNPKLPTPGISHRNTRLRSRVTSADSEMKMNITPSQATNVPNIFTPLPSLSIENKANHEPPTPGSSTESKRFKFGTNNVAGEMDGINLEINAVDDAVVFTSTLTTAKRNPKLPTLGSSRRTTRSTSLDNPDATEMASDVLDSCTSKQKKLRWITPTPLRRSVRIRSRSSSIGEIALEVESNDLQTVEEPTAGTSTSTTKVNVPVDVRIEAGPSRTTTIAVPTGPGTPQTPLTVSPLPSTYRDIQNEEENLALLHAMANAEYRADLARVRAEHIEQIENARGRERQLATYMLATRRRDIRPHNLGTFDRVCQHCEAKFFTNEVNTRGSYRKCCFDGNVRLPPLQPLPIVLDALYNNLHPLSRNFLRYILKYNNAFQFASCEATLRETPPGRGPMVYSIQGKMYLHLADVVVPDPRNAKYGPLYFLETDEAVNRRGEIQTILNPQLLSLLERIIRENNPFAQGYQVLRQRYDDQRTEGVEAPLVFLEIIQSRNIRRRELDMPTVNEVAAVYTANERNPPFPRLAVYTVGQNRGLKTLNYFYATCDPLVFPLLFPSGDLGWQMRMPHARGTRHITPCEYYAYRLAYRGNNFDVLHRSGKLSQQYIVAAFTKVESNNISFIMQNQGALRKERYQGLMDYVHNRAEQENVNVGQMYILPSTYSGSPRSQMQRFQDAMAVVGQLGKPSLFITMTCNPKWPEIIDNIPAGDEANNHPMLVVRVFKAKLSEMMEEIWKRHIFGVPIAYLYVIEFQKRGLPHAHILVTLRAEDELSHPYIVDQIITTEIPNSEIDIDLYELVRSNMVHGPCGRFNPQAPCMDDGKCKKHYPKQYSDETVITEPGNVIYKRLISERRIPIRTRELDEQQFSCEWVVPYNPYLLLKYRCHINVEACATLKSVKYLYKYFFKHADAALVRIVEQHQNDADVAPANNNNQRLDYNEVEHYLNTRYMSPMEAAWHLNQFEMHNSSHTVYRLAVHLPLEQVVVFRPGQEQQAAQRQETTMLTGWFELNQRDPAARQYLYTEIPLHYVWQTGEKEWTPRRRRCDKTISRLYTVCIRYRELYYLRTLLLHIRGATSYEDIRTVDGQICATYEEACRMRGLLADDAEWHRCLTEASEKQMPKQLRQLFAYILVFCEVHDPLTLWETFRQALIEDFLRRQMPDAEAIQRALRAIQAILIINGRRLNEFNIDEPIIGIIFYDDDDDDGRNENQVLNDHLDRLEMHLHLNADQQTVFDTVMDAIHNVNQRRRLFYLSGPGGTGKTFLYNSIINLLGNECVAVAWTGIAANLLQSGRTVHSRFKLPVPTTATSVSKLTPRCAESQLLKRIKLIIWDEISMSTRVVFDLVDRTMRDICQNDLPFGGKVVLVGGDFRQCLPVVNNGTRVDIVLACVKQSNLWPLFQKFELTTNIRAQEDNTGFANWLLQLGNGTLEGIPCDDGKIIPVPPEFVVNDKEELINRVFPDLRPYRVPNSAILTTLNRNCEIINQEICEKFPGRSHTYHSADSVIEDDETVIANYTVEFLNSLTPSGCAPHKLILKQGVVAMILRNLNVRKGICNGTRCIIRHLGNTYIEVEIINGHGHLTGDLTFIPRIDFIPVETNLPFKMKRRQFPLKIAYATTINKSQGQTYDSVGIYLPSPVFTHGQLYVALSRAKRGDSVSVFIEPTLAQGRILNTTDSIYTKNIVYPEALQ